MEVLQPTFGLFFWSLIIFVSFFFLLKKFAWKPILSALKEREDSIEDSLQEAAKARDEMQELTSQNEQIIQEARAERDQILKEARVIKDQLIAKAREEAQEESSRMLKKVKAEIHAEKMAALTEIKNQVGQLSIQIAEKLMKKELSQANAQEAVVDQMISEIQLN